MVILSFRGLLIALAIAAASVIGARFGGEQAQTLAPQPPTHFAPGQQREISLGAFGLPGDATLPAATGDSRRGWHHVMTPPDAWGARSGAGAAPGGGPGLA